NPSFGHILLSCHLFLPGAPPSPGSAASRTAESPPPQPSAAATPPSHPSAPSPSPPPAQQPAGSPKTPPAPRPNSPDDSNRAEIKIAPRALAPHALFPCKKNGSGPPTRQRKTTIITESCPDPGRLTAPMNQPILCR